MSESPDEVSHWEYARYIHDHWRLPHYDQGMVEGNQPPLYYFLIAPLATPSSLPAARFSFGPNGPQRPCFPLSFDVCFSDFSRFWPLRRARLLTALFSVLTVFFVYMAAVEINGSPYTGLLAGTLLICLPEFAFRGGNVSNDGMVATSSALATYSIIRLRCRGFSVKAGMIGSLCVALAFLSKISGIILVPVLAGVLLSFPGHWILKLKRLSVLLVAGLCAAPWLIRNQILYQDPLASKAMFAAVPGLINIKTLGSPWLRTTFPAALGKSLVGAFGGAGDVFLSGAVNQAFGFLAMAAFAGLAYSLYKRKIDWRVILPLIALVVLAIASTVQLNMIISQPQGRYLFAGLPAMAVLTAAGLGGLPEWNRVFHYGSITLLMGVSLYALLGVEIPSFWSAVPTPLVTTPTDFYILPSNVHPAGPLLEGNTFGQTFVSTSMDLSSVEVEVATYGKKINQGQLKLHLRTSPSAARDIASVTVPASGIKDNTFIPLRFSPIKDSKGHSFYFFMETENMSAENALTVWVSNSDFYPNGQFYANGKGGSHDMILRAWDTIIIKACGACGEQD